jgi:hypothetical protein
MNKIHGTTGNHYLKVHHIHPLPSQLQRQVLKCCFSARSLVVVTRSNLKKPHQLL